MAIVVCYGADKAKLLKNTRFACVCAFFVVTLQSELH